MYRDIALSPVLSKVFEAVYNTQDIGWDYLISVINYRFKEKSRSTHAFYSFF